MDNSPLGSLIILIIAFVLFGWWFFPLVFLFGGIIGIYKTITE